MKCPHCKTGIAEEFKSAGIASYGQLTLLDGTVVPPAAWHAFHQQCPECHDFIIHLVKTGARGPAERFVGYPHVVDTARDIPKEVSSPFKQDFSEACLVLTYSAKASAALSRRLLQTILREKGGAKKKDLADQIDELVSTGGVPSYITKQLHAVRNIGNFASHPIKSKNTGEIVDVEPGEAEWNLDVIESLFDFYFVQPTLAEKRRTDLNKKLKDAGKPEII